ncbi:MAG: undecaprenyl-diphosphatase [Halobacteriovoraceae bacterium]|nr:undecaprenyl-diphosphatase [Halobacteriovoraceae bacterium]|tara:strand:- start:34843 stop:35646 length:804 start_codon:yes stop_codon:yes gene_type:complete
MTLDWAFFYGFIQGVTEFLPISSSGHLALIPFFFTLKDPGVLFDLMMHLGTALAVILYFRAKVLKIVKDSIALIFKRDLENTIFTQHFLLATGCSFVLILFIKNLALEYGRNPIIIALNFIVFGFLMYWADRKAEKDYDLKKEKHFKFAALIGLSQSLAVFPGVSRSGITLTSSRFMNMSRYQASEFSFLLSLPVILGSILFKLPDIIQGEAIAVETSVMVWGVLFSFMFGILTIHFFLKIIARVGLIYFSLYRLLIGALLLYLSLS